MLITVEAIKDKNHYNSPISAIFTSLKAVFTIFDIPEALRHTVMPGLQPG